MLENIKNILAIDSTESKIHKKKKEPDQISTSSTATNTNFTGKVGWIHFTKDFFNVVHCSVP